MCHSIFRTTATGPTYAAQQSGYVAQTAAYTQRSGYDQAAFQAAAASQGNYTGKYLFIRKISMQNPIGIKETSSGSFHVFNRIFGGIFFIYLLFSSIKFLIEV